MNRSFASDIHTRSRPFFHPPQSVSPPPRTPHLTLTSSLLFSHPQGTKGTGGAILILEEAARIDPALFKETIAPLLLVEHTALIGITTPMDEVCVPVHVQCLKTLYILME